MASIQKKTVKGIDYWYLIESKRVNGKVKTAVVEYYGNTKKFVKRFQDNLNRSENIVLKSFSHGATHALLKISGKLGIGDVLDEIFSPQIRDGIKRSASLILVAIQRVCKPASKNAFSEWFQTTTLPDELKIHSEPLTSSHFWDQMDGITEDQIRTAENEISKRIFERYNLKLDKIALDYTNYFSFIDSENEKCELAKRGKNKQKRNDLRQYSLAVVASKEIGIPFYSHVYKGNTNDQTEFLEYINQLKERIPGYEKKELTIVFDGGSVNKKNLESIDNYYICRFPLSSCKKLYDIKTETYGNVVVNGKDIPCYRSVEEIWDSYRTCILTFSQKLFNGEARELETNIAKTITLIEELNEKLKNKNSRLKKTRLNVEDKLKSILSKAHMIDIFEIELIGVRKIKEIKYTVNFDMKEEIKSKYFGKKLIITNRDNWSDEEIVKTYHDQDCIEKIFKNSKNNHHFSIRPQYHHTDQKIRVHIFCCLLGLILVGALNKELSDKGIVISNEKLVDTLQNIRQCWIKETDSNKITKVLEEIDAFGRDIWNSVLGI